MLSIYDMDVEHQCKDMIDKECNLRIINYFCGLYISTGMRFSSHFDDVVSFQAVLDISKYSNNFEQIPTTNKCNETQVLDSKKNDCRGIICYPGRILMRTGCEPIFKITRDLAYILSLGMTTELVHDINKPLSFLKSVRRSFTIYLKGILNIQTETVTSSVFLANSICAENITRQNGTKLNITLYRKFVIREYVERSNLEEKLISLQNGYFVVRYGRQKYNFKLFKNVEALTAESHISTLRYLQRCFLKTITQTKDSYVYSHVNKLLVCKQIEFETTEFNIRSSKLIVLSTKIELDYDEYAIMSPGKTRICLETFRKMFTKDKSEGRNVWGIIEMTCACTSLVCLVVTFITYCVFSTLRTLTATAIQIVKRPQLQNERQIKSNRIHAAIYLKLFSVTGISWLLHIIDTFLPMSTFSIIVSVLNDLQGIFIFWSFICNKRVLNLYWKSCTSNRNKNVKEIAGKSEQETKSIELTTSKQEE
ncbi:unnamed protein product [Mytilus coruscus]|uniref:G-protein coupled receptors family 2 profile 2 domain-containing protein n=1 Tax=Mytilus coruscus TaxID=42192 RepID=A0A6J8EWC8_MYTCO|nr:unnamed protein product [Mytilus coruscus]